MRVARVRVAVRIVGADGLLRGAETEEESQAGLGGIRGHGRATVDRVRPEENAVPRGQILRAAHLGARTTR